MGKSDVNKEELQNCFGQVLRQARKNVGLSQEKLALETGLDRTYISLLERGLRTPSLYTLMLISKRLDIPVSSMVADVEAIYKV
jgi:transcriptional regulator with XRE-family HTH domain